MFKINEVIHDEFGRYHGVLLVYKDEGVTSHDVVDKFRKEFKTKRVGHGGALDPFAKGLMIILIGKATKLSESFIAEEKEYIADILLGISTNTLDTEGEIREIKSNVDIANTDINSALNSFKPEYKQYVPVFSSVKVNGTKLRELAHKFEFDIFDEGDTRKAIFHKGNGDVEVDLPHKIVKLYKLELISISEVDLDSYKANSYTEDFFKTVKEKGVSKVKIAKVLIRCSKGTYIRQFADDLGKELKIPSMLVALERTALSNLTYKDLKDYKPTSLKE